jgi:hypothetical protein
MGNSYHGHTVEVEHTSRQDSGPDFPNLFWKIKRVIVTDIYLLIGSACPGPACIAKVEGLINEGRKAW